jgi:hypothetical protein
MRGVDHKGGVRHIQITPDERSKQMSALKPFLNKDGNWQVDVYLTDGSFWFSMTYDTHRDAEAYFNGFTELA